MLNKMDKFDIFVPHPLTNTSLLIQLSPKYGCKPLVCLLKRPVLLSLDFQDRSIRNYSCHTFGGGAVKRRVKAKKKFKIKGKKNI